MTKNQPHMRNTIHILLQCDTHRSGGRCQKVVHGKDQPPYEHGEEDVVVSQQVKALVRYQAGTSSFTMDPPFAPREMWDPTKSKAMVTQKVQRLRLADCAPLPPPPPQARTATHSSGTSYDLRTTEEPQSKERTDALAHSNT